MSRCIAFHSYKGGTGKTTIACNLAAMLSLKGYNVSLLDLDVYAPSLHAYFDYSPNKWINDLLFENSDLNEIMVDMTSTLTRHAAGKSKKTGRLLVGFSNPQKEEIYRLEGSIKTANANIQLLRRFVQLREDLISDYESDYVILDTSPGIRYWSINSLAIADVLFLTLKFGDLDIEGTIKMANDIYGSFTKFGSKSFLLLNLVSGYCLPRTYVLSSNAQNKNNKDVTGEGTPIEIQTFQNELGSDTFLSDQAKMDLLSAIPCYCDIQFQKKEFLTVLQYPDHPFAKQIEQLAMTRQIAV
ncbi:MAG TPA: AAA family ATPase [Nitrososphaera sp.]|jgi:chromosome partitioning protein|nr:AAA family ATPase [Nitrososphaera sp.]